jgi:phage repressor protein C with HTH and peptisase S24 domain
MTRDASLSSLREPHQRLRYAREEAGYESATAAAQAIGVDVPTYLGHENGSRGLSRAASRYATFFNVSLDWLLDGRGEAKRGNARTAPASSRAASPPREPAPRRRGDGEVVGPVAIGFKIPVYGQAVGGEDGRFELNGNRIADVLAPPSLQGVPDAYAVYVVGDSMEPRYFAGETVFVNPRLPVRRGDFVVVQIAEPDGEPAAYIKRFMVRDGRNLRLEQFNPKKTIEFPANRLISIHRIIMGGDG